MTSAHGGGAAMPEDNDPSRGPLVPDGVVVLGFLRDVIPEGPWCLSLSLPDKKGLKTRTFMPGEEAELIRWLDANRSGADAYYHGNRVRGRMAKKPSREDFTHVSHLHVDIDPRAGEVLADEQERIRVLLLGDSPRGLPQPTWVIFSGGGYQALWRLREPIPLADLAAGEDAALFNLEIANKLDGDRCHSIDHLLRLPGTVNWPDEKKQRRGQRPTVACVVLHDPTRVHDLTAFKKAEHATVDVATLTVPLRLPASVGPVPSLDVLPSTVSDRCKQIIEHGHDPEEPTRLPSRSEWLFSAVCEMVRAKVPDETVLGIITDARWRISASVLEQKKSRKYAERQIQRAKAKTALPGMPDGRPRFPLPRGDHHHRDVAILLGRELAATGRYYNHLGRWVMLTEEGRFKGIAPAAAVTHLESVAGFGYLDRDGELVCERMTKEVADILARSEELLEQLPEIRIVTDCPVLIESDERPRTVTGYDEGSRTFARGRAPDRVRLSEARELLLDLLCDYDFVTPGDAARAIAIPISAALVMGGWLLPGRGPLHVVEGDESQAGKGLLCQLVAAMFGTRARKIARSERGGGVGSLAESLSRAFLDGEPIIQIDNQRGAVADAFLEAAITESPIEARALRISGLVDPSRTVLLMTSNKAEFTRDLANRSNFVRIRKRPDGYRFRDWGCSIVEHVRRHQPRYLGSLFTVITEWHARDKPTASDAGHDFRRWAGIIRWILVDLLGLADPIAEVRQIQARVTSKARNWLRDIVLAVVKRGQAGATLTASDIRDVAIAEGLEVPGWAEGEESTGSDARMRVAAQQVGKRLGVLFGPGDDVKTLQEGEWVLRRAVRQRAVDETHTRPQPVYRVDRFAPELPAWRHDESNRDDDADESLGQGEIPF